MYHRDDAAGLCTPGSVNRAAAPQAVPTRRPTTQSWAFLFMGTDQTGKQLKPLELPLGASILPHLAFKQGNRFNVRGMGKHIDHSRSTHAIPRLMDQQVGIARQRRRIA
jgi:hypothetical protein